MQKITKKASLIYARQNKLLHKAFARAGFPYNQDKVVWLKLMTDIAGRPVKGLSELTLSERHRLILHFRSVRDYVWSRKRLNRGGVVGIFPLDIGSPAPPIEKERVICFSV